MARPSCSAHVASYLIRKDRAIYEFRRISLGTVFWGFQRFNPMLTEHIVEALTHELLAIFRENRFRRPKETEDIADHVLCYALWISSETKLLWASGDNEKISGFFRESNKGAARWTKLRMNRLYHPVIPRHLLTCFFVFALRKWQFYDHLQFVCGSVPNFPSPTKCPRYLLRSDMGNLSITEENWFLFVFSCEKRLLLTYYNSQIDATITNIFAWCQTVQIDRQNKQ